MYKIFAKVQNGVEGTGGFLLLLLDLVRFSWRSRRESFPSLVFLALLARFALLALVLGR